MANGFALLTASDVAWPFLVSHSTMKTRETPTQRRASDFILSALFLLFLFVSVSENRPLYLILQRLGLLLPSYPAVHAFASPSNRALILGIVAVLTRS